MIAFDLEMKPVDLTQQLILGIYKYCLEVACVLGFCLFYKTDNIIMSCDTCMEYHAILCNEI